MREITLKDTMAIAIGAGILGTGGGGNTYLGRVALNKALEVHARPVRVIDAEDVPDDAYVCAIGGMGAPTVGIEKLPNGAEFTQALRALEAHLQKKFFAVVIGEIGGANALQPLITALEMDLPVIDGDGMGRAFPELQMDTFSIGGVTSNSPLALADIYGNAVIFHSIDNPARAEDYARALTIRMGGTAALAMPAMNGAQLKAHLIRHTLTLAQQIGEAVLDARAQNADVPAAIAERCRGVVLLRGKIADVMRRTSDGFAHGEITLLGFGETPETMQIVFQNENLIAWQNGEVRCAVPDLITLVDLESGEPIGTEMLRYGLRVAVVAIPAPRELKTPAALAVVGPSAFGYAHVPFTPMAGNLLD